MYKYSSSVAQYTPARIKMIIYESIHFREKLCYNVFFVVAPGRAGLKPIAPNWERILKYI
jgi:hypothetical protein